MLGDGALNTRTTAAGVRIQEAGTNLLKLSEQTIYRYAKNYETDGVRFCLFVRTYSDNATEVERQLDDYASKMTKPEVVSAIAGADINHFKYTTNFVEVN